MIIGNFVYDPDRDTYTGRITTLSVDRSVVFHAINKTADKGPDYRVLDGWEAANAELGAGWKRTNASFEAAHRAIDATARKRALRERNEKM